MRTFRKSALLLFAGLWWISGCAEVRKMVQVDDSFNGKEVELRVGQTLAVNLSENASTGFRWIIRPESAHQLETIMRQEEPAVEAAAGPPGKPGVRHFYFKATRPGTVDLELHYRRTWETAKPPGRTFQLHVRVVPA